MNVIGGVARQEKQLGKGLEYLPWPEMWRLTEALKRSITDKDGQRFWKQLNIRHGAAGGRGRFIPKG